jgi:hypothetical protein
MADDEERCEDCETAALGGITISLCRGLGSKELDCNKLSQQFISGDLSLDELIQIVRAKANGRFKEQFDEIESLAEE